MDGLAGPGWDWDWEWACAELVDMGIKKIQRVSILFFSRCCFFTAYSYRWF
jgi:hypothetical protein